MRFGQNHRAGRPGRLVAIHELVKGLRHRRQPGHRADGKAGFAQGVDIRQHASIAAAVVKLGDQMQSVHDASLPQGRGERLTQTPQRPLGRQHAAELRLLEDRQAADVGMGKAQARAIGRKQPPLLAPDQPR